MGANIVLNYGQIHFLGEHWHKLHHLQKVKNIFSEDILTPQHQSSFIALLCSVDGSLWL